MRKSIIILAFCISGLRGFSQLQSPVRVIDTTAASKEYWAAWLKDLYDVGVVMNKDSILISEDARKIIIDSNYRKLIYPLEYTWPSTIDLLQRMELKKGFWYLFNLYTIDTSNKAEVIRTLVSFDQGFDMRKALVSVFYTYAMLNPKHSVIKDGRPVILRPDALEKEFGKLKELIYYIDYYRKERADKKEPGN